MNLHIKAAFICLTLISLMSVTGTFSYFTDEETSVANEFNSGEWHDDEWCLEVNTSKTTLTGIGDESKLHGTRIRNKCDHNITIESIWISWEGPEASNMTKINILGTRWEGSVPSGYTPPCEVNHDVLPGKPWQHIYFFFDDNTITGPFVFDFIMSDGSEKYVLWPE